MDDTRWIRKKGRKWIITVPPEVRRWLGITHRRGLFWHLTRQREAVLTTEATRKAGRPGLTELTRALAAARAEIAAIQHRDATRDRGLYAEGFAHGYIQAHERLAVPDGPSAERGRRRALYRWAYPDAAYLTDPKQLAPRAAPSRPRMNARTRRAKADARLGRAVETVRGPDEFTSEGAASSEAPMVVEREKPAEV